MVLGLDRFFCGFYLECVYKMGRDGELPKQWCIHLNPNPWGGREFKTTNTYEAKTETWHLWFLQQLQELTQLIELYHRPLRC